MQSTSEEKALEAHELIQKFDVHKDLRDAFLCIHEVITDTSENKHVTDRKKTDRRGKSKATPKEKEKKQLSSTDREIIVEGTFHCQKKFDCVEEFAKKGQLDDTLIILSERLEFTWLKKRVILMVLMMTIIF